ncbi:MAG TPA: hypothetical protein VJ738_17665 [Steroidobacteraceae bacterium]|nr:hypothetical protein [Steroidobacteraceae bacterium]
MALVALLASGCAVTHRIRPDILPRESTQAMVPQWPVMVGLYVAPSVKTMVLKRQWWRVRAGDTIASSFRWATRQIFAGVADVDSLLTAGDTSPRLAGTIALIRVVAEGGPQSFGNLRYEMALYSRDGKEIDRWTLVTPVPLWDAPASSPVAMRSVASDIGYAIRNETAQYMADFTSRTAVRLWLSAQGVNDPTVRPTLRTDRAASASEAIVVVPDMNAWLYTDSAVAESCIGHRLAESSPPLEVIPIDRIRLEFFPWLEPAVAPKSREAMRQWLQGEGVQTQLRALGIRYFLEFRGGTKMDTQGGMLCSYGCLGFIWGHRQSSFSAYLLDVRRNETWTEETAVRRGRVIVPAFLLPVPLIAATKTAACEELADKIRAAVSSTSR